MVYIFETVHISSSKIGKLAWIRIPTWFLWKSINVIAACSYVGFGSSLNHQRLIRNLASYSIQNRKTGMDPDPNMVSMSEYQYYYCVFLRRLRILSQPSKIDPEPYLLVHPKSENGHGSGSQHGFYVRVSMLLLRVPT